MANIERIRMLEEMLLESPGDAFCLYALALEYASADGDNEKAIDLLAALKSLHPEYLPLYYQFGLVYKETGHPDLALNVLKEGIELALSTGDAHTLAELRFLMEDIEDA